MQPLLFQAPTTTAEHHHGRNVALLNLLKQQSHQRQRQLVFPGRAAALTGEHRLVGEVTPAALALDPPQQWRVCLQRLTGWTKALEAQTHHSLVTGSTGGDAMARLARQQGHKTALLVVQQQIAMGCPAPLGWIAVAVEPGLTTAAQPTAQQPVGESVVGRRGVTHPPTLRLPAARSTEVQAVPWHRLPSL